MTSSCVISTVISAAGGAGSRQHTEASPSRLPRNNTPPEIIQKTIIYTGVTNIQYTVLKILLVQI